jgi:hypothetical protein
LIPTYVKGGSSSQKRLGVAKSWAKTSVLHFLLLLLQWTADWRSKLGHVWWAPHCRSLSWGRRTYIFKSRILHPIRFSLCQRPCRPNQGCQIFLGTRHQNGKNRPNEHKIDQMVTKYTKMAVK